MSPSLGGCHLNEVLTVSAVDDDPSQAHRSGRQQERFFHGVAGHNVRERWIRLDTRYSESSVWAQKHQRAHNTMA